MILDFLASAYELYKDQTKFVLGWLTQEGRACNVRPPGRRATASSTTAGVGSAYMIDVNDILPFARLVVDASPKSPSDEVLKNLRQAITSRRQATDQYQLQSSNDPSLEQSNESHRHFTRVLEELLALLTAAHSKGKATVSSEPPRHLEGTLEPILAQQNPYSILELEASTSADEHDSLAIASQADLLPKPDSSKVQTEVTYQYQDPVEKLRFAVSWMLADSHRVRIHIHECLERYRTRELSLVSLSAIINCAIGMVRSIEREFIVSIPQPNSWENVMKTIVSHSQFEEVSKRSYTSYLRSLYCLPFEELRRFRENLVRGKAGEAGEVLFGHVSVLRVEASQIDNENNWKADKIILHELLKNVVLLGSKRSLPSEDELTRGIKEVFEDQPVHLWVVFGLQILLDTQYILGEDVTRAFREFKASSDTFKGNVEHYIKYSQIIRKKRYDESEQAAIRRNSLGLTEWTTDDIFMKLRETSPALDKDKGPAKPFFFLSHNPVVCGVMQCAALLKLQSGGIKIMNKSIYAASAAHLYHAVKNEGCLPSEWPDMKKLIDLYRRDIFLGDKPKNISTYLSRYKIVRGASVTNWAVDNRGDFKYSDQGPRELKVSKIMETFEDFLCQTDATNHDINVDLLERFLHQTAHGQATQKKGKSNSVEPVQLLVLLEQCLKKEEAKLFFNYYALHFHCWMLLTKAYLELQDEFTKWLTATLGPDVSKDNMNLLLYLLPPYIFDRMAEESSKKGSKKGNKKDDKESAGEESIVSRVGRVMDAYISEEAQNPSPPADGVVDDSGLQTETEHGTQNGVCIHWGPCP